MCRDFNCLTIPTRVYFLGHYESVFLFSATIFLSSLVLLGAARLKFKAPRDAPAFPTAFTRALGVPNEKSVRIIDALGLRGH